MTTRFEEKLEELVRGIRHYQDTAERMQLAYDAMLRAKALLSENIPVAEPVPEPPIEQPRERPDVQGAILDYLASRGEMWLSEREVLNGLSHLREGSVKAALATLVRVDKLELGGGRGNRQYRRRVQQETVSEPAPQEAEPTASAAPLRIPPATRERILAFIKSTGSAGTGDGQLDLIRADERAVDALVEDGLIVRGNDDRYRLVLSAGEAEDGA